MHNNLLHHRWLPAIWAVVVGLIAVHQVYFWQSPKIELDVQALLPESRATAIQKIASDRLATSANHAVVILVGGPDWKTVSEAARLVRDKIKQTGGALEPAFSASIDTKLATGELYRWRARLLTDQQRVWLESASDEMLKSRALQNLYQFGGQEIPWTEDPIGLWLEWLRERIGRSNLIPKDGELTFTADSREWVLIQLKTDLDAFSASGKTNYHQTLHDIKRQLKTTHPEASYFVSGVPLIAEAAAQQASQEVSWIGGGSLIAVIVLVWLTFASTRPVLLIAISLVIGCAAALSVTTLVFERVHLLTLVFGASLVGVAEDYGFHYFSARQKIDPLSLPDGHSKAHRVNVLHSLIPGLSLALLTSALAYAAIGLSPFPALQQMAVFSIVGLCAAFLTVLAWFPFFDRGEIKETAFARQIAQSLNRWPRWTGSRWGFITFGILLACILSGMLQLQTRDDVKQLFNMSPSLLSDQKVIHQTLNPPSSSQYFLTCGTSAEVVLQREEKLKSALQSLPYRNAYTSHLAVSDWVPSAARQTANRELFDRVEKVARDLVAELSNTEVAHVKHGEVNLNIDDWLKMPISAPLRSQWLVQSSTSICSILLLTGLSASNVNLFQQLPQHHPGVRWVNQTAETSRVLARFRTQMSFWLGVGVVAVALVLWRRYSYSAWRAMASTILGGLLTLSIYGWIGHPIQLFDILALMLLLGMGVDYGIFLLEHPNDNHAWLAVALAGVSTLLAFGLLAFSSTPALHSFGLTMLIGELFIWLLAPVFRAPSDITSNHQ